MSDRKYAMTKGLGPGDWLLPGNNGKKLWRITKYEDGPSHGLDPEVFPKDFTAWQLWRWPHTALPVTVDDLQDWDRWELEEQGLKTREDAIQAALRSELSKPKPKRPADPRPIGQILVEGSRQEEADNA